MILWSFWNFKLYGFINILNSHFQQNTDLPLILSIAVAAPKAIIDRSYEVDKLTE